jgi:hypothetical protein
MAISLIDYAVQSEMPMRRGLVQRITNESIFLRRLKFITIDGYVYQYNREETLGGVAFRGLNEDYTDDTVGVINPQVESLSIFGGPVKTDRSIANLPSGAAVRASRIASKVRKAGLFYDKYCIDGDPATNPKQFYGLNARLTGAQIISAGTNGATLTLAMVDDAIDKVVGTQAQKILVCNKAIRRKITALVVGSAGGAAVLDVGKQLTEYNGVPIEVIDEDGDEAAILGFDETQGSSAVTTSLYVIRPGSDADGEFVQGLVNTKLVEHEDQGVRGTQYIDLIEAGMGLAMFHPRSAARVKGITNT